MNPILHMFQPAPTLQPWPEDRRIVNVLEVEEDRALFEDAPEISAIKQGKRGDRRTARLKAIVSVLRRSSSATPARDLASMFGVCVDVIHQDARRLRTQGYAVEGITGMGYVIKGAA